MKFLRTAASVLALACLTYVPAPGSTPRRAAGSDKAAGGAVYGRQQRPAGRLTVTGRLTGEGVECQAFRARNGTLYTLTGNLRGFKAGDRVTVVGRVAEMSTCMQGTTLVVESIRRVRR